MIQPTNRKHVFVCYSHADKLQAHRLRIHLEPLEMMHQVCYFIDEKIDPGEEWEKRITDALISCETVVLLLSADLLASRFIQYIELPGILKRAKLENVRLLIVSLNHCVIPEFLSELQFVNDPAKPLSAMKPAKREEVWKKVITLLKSDVASERWGKKSEDSDSINENAPRVTSVISNFRDEEKSQFVLNFAKRLSENHVECLVRLFTLDRMFSPLMHQLALESGKDALSPLPINSVIRLPLGFDLLASDVHSEGKFVLDPSFRHWDYHLEQLKRLDQYSEILIVSEGRALDYGLASLTRQLLLCYPGAVSLTSTYALIKVAANTRNLSSQLVMGPCSSFSTANAIAKRIQKIANEFLHKDLPLLGYYLEGDGLPKYKRGYDEKRRSTMEHIIKNFLDFERKEEPITSSN